MEQTELLKKARTAFKSADKKEKDLLAEIFGKEAFVGNIMEQITSFEDARAHLNLDLKIPFPNPSNTREAAANAFYKLDIIAEALRDGVKLDWSDSGQKKWFPWFEYTPSGFRFDVSAYVGVYASSTGGSRLCLDTQAKANYFGKQFADLWVVMLNPDK